MSDTKGFQISDMMNINDSINRHRTTALGVIESKEPALATVCALKDAESSRVEHAQGGIFVFLNKVTFLYGRKSEVKLLYPGALTTAVVFIRDWKKTIQYRH